MGVEARRNAEKPKVLEMPEPEKLTKEGAINVVNQLWQVTRTAPQNADVHIQCVQMRDALLKYLG